MTNKTRRNLVRATVAGALLAPVLALGGPAQAEEKTYDLLGVFTDFKPKFTKRFANLTEVAVAGLSRYVEEVKTGVFPDEDHSYAVKDEEYERFLGLVEKRRQI